MFGSPRPRRLDPDAALVCRQPRAPLCSVVSRHHRRRKVGMVVGVVGVGEVLWGIPCSHHFSTRRSTRAPCLYTHKSACHFYCLLLCSQGDVFSLLVPSPSFFFLFSFLPSASSPPLHLRETSRGFPPRPPLRSLLSLDRGGRLGCLVMAT